MKILILVSILCMTTCWPAAVMNKQILKSCYRQDVVKAVPATADHVTLINPFFLIN